MPRPLRIREREAQTATAPVDPTLAPEAAPIDAEPKASDKWVAGLGQAEESPLAEGEVELARKVAKRMGWRPVEDWQARGRDPATWVDAPDYLTKTPDEIVALRARNIDLDDKLKRTGQVAHEAIEAARAQARIDAEAELRRATASGNEDAAVTAAQRLAANSGPPPVVAEWIGRNRWFETDPAAHAVAREESNRLARLGRPVDEQLEAAETEVRKRFPEHFGQVDKSNGSGETRLANRPPPAVEGGSRASTPQRDRAKGWNDIPSTVRHQMTAPSKHGGSLLAILGRKLGSTEEAQKRMAASYWREQGEVA